MASGALDLGALDCFAPSASLVGKGNAGRFRLGSPRISRRLKGGPNCLAFPPDRDRCLTSTRIPTTVSFVGESA